MFDYVNEDSKTPICAQAIKEIDQLPKKEDFDNFSPLIWSEHCLECSAPECYQSCKMYENNRYGRCMRTDYAIRVNRDFDFPAVQLRFRKWGKLLCAFNTAHQYTADGFLKKYKRYLKIRNAMLVLDRLGNRFLKDSHKDFLARLVHHNWIKRYGVLKKAKVDYEELYLAFYSMNVQKFYLMLNVQDANNRTVSKLSYEVKPGLNIWRIKKDELDNQDISVLELYPYDNFCAELVFFYSDLVSFRHVHEEGELQKPAKKAKCVIWDLDNTVWDGVIGECGITNIKLRENVVSVIEKLDKKGVLQSVCSKNDFNLAWEAICKFKLDKYFLYPKINWDYKSENIKRLARQLNIHVNTFVFIDDSQSEREEVSAMIPCVRVYSDTIVDSLLSLPEFDLPITEESLKRRSYYKMEEKRNQVFEESKESNYKSFIQRCNFQVEISECKSEEDIGRCHELIQRTNQLNSSTNRIEYEDFRKIVFSGEKKVFKFTCADNFGSYGVVGCLIIKLTKAAVLCTDFVMSCRVAKKKIEPAIISFLMNQYKKEVRIVYYPTARNRVLLEEFTSNGGQYIEDRNEIIFKVGKVLDDDWVAVKNIY